MNYDVLEKIIGRARRGSDDLDMQIWAVAAGHSPDGEMPHFALQWFDDARTETFGKPRKGISRVSTDVSSAMAFADTLLPGHTMVIARNVEGQRVTMVYDIKGQSFEISRGEDCDPDQLALAIAYTTAVLTARINAELALPVSIADHVIALSDAAETEVEECLEA